MARFGFCGGTYLAPGPNIDAEEAINVYCENSESAGARTTIALLQSPGTAIFAALNETQVPALFAVNGRLFAAATNLYEIMANGTVVQRGAFGNGPPDGPCQMQSNQTQLLVLQNGKLYVLTLATNVFAAVNMAQFNGSLILQIEFIDGYFFASLPNSNTIQVSNLEDGTTWSGLNLATVSYFPDNVVSLICNDRVVWLLSNKRSIGYYNAGAGYPPFIPIQGAFLEDGSGAAFGCVRADNTFFYLNQDERGFMICKRLSGLGPGIRVSTHAVEFAWQRYATVADAIGYSYQENGHTFVHYYFPTANASWRFDISTGLWHKVGYYNPNGAPNPSYVGLPYSAHRSQCHAFIWGKHLVGDCGSGTIYQMSSQFYTDAGNPLRWIRRSPTISKENAYMYFSKLEIDVEVGLGPSLSTPPFIVNSTMPGSFVLEDSFGILWTVTINDQEGQPYLSMLPNAEGTPTTIFLQDIQGESTAWEIVIEPGPEEGTVNTIGSTVVWVSGNNFNQGWQAGLPIVINGVNYEIASVEGPYELTLTTSAGAQNGVGFALNKLTTVAVAFNANYPNQYALSTTPGQKDSGIEVLASGQLQVVPGVVQTRPPQMMLRWSDDHGQTWSNTYLLNCGKIGQYLTRAIRFMLGRSRHRIWEVSGSDPIPWRIADAYLDADPGYAPQERLSDQARKVS